MKSSLVRPSFTFSFFSLLFYFDYSNLSNERIYVDTFFREDNLLLNKDTSVS